MPAHRTGWYRSARSILPVVNLLAHQISACGTLIVLASGLLCASRTSAQILDREELKKATPNLSGQRNGVDLEPDPLNFQENTGFQSLFDGKSLSGWDGRPGVWKAENGEIVGTSTLEKKSGSTFLVYRRTSVRNFDLKLEIKIENGGGSGVQYRSHTGIPQGRVAHAGEPPLDPRWVMIGPEADFSFPTNEEDAAYSGQIYSQNTSQGILAWRGQVVQIRPHKFPTLLGVIGNRAQLGAAIKKGWNEYEIVACEGVILHLINGQLMAVLVDDDRSSPQNQNGSIGLQILGAPCTVSFRNIWLRKLH